ncbi:MAG TPA: EamA family transporter [Streptosporangiaceae bacterium]
MSLTAVALILVAAVAHAVWNLCSKQASAVSAAGFVWLLAVVAGILYAPVIAVDLIAAHPHLTAPNWWFMAGTGVLQTGYFVFLQHGYRLGDLSVVYPIGRGSGALLSALAGIVLLGERPGPLGIAGIVCLVAGVIVLGLPERRRDPPPADQAAPAAARVSAPPAAPSSAGPAPAPLPPPASVRPAARLAVGLALGVGVFIAAYTLWDKHAVSTLHTPAPLQGYAAFPAMIVGLAPSAWRDRAGMRVVWRSYRIQLWVAAALAPLAYILVLTALAFSSVAAIAPAREVSVLFGVILGGKLLGEGSLARRLAAAAAVVAGIIAIAIG